MGTWDEGAVQAWAAVVGVEIEDVPGCPGVLIPGVAILIDHAMEHTVRLHRTAHLLRQAGLTPPP